MSSQENKTEITAKMLIVPPLVSAVTVGIGSGLFVLGITLKAQGTYPVQTTIMAVGVGVVLGFMWGSLIWTDRLVRRYQPIDEQYELEETDPVVDPLEDTRPRRIQIELRDDSDGLSVRWLDLPEGITMEQLIDTGKLLVKNGMNFSHTLSGNGKPLTRKQFEALRDLCLNNNLAQWRNNRAHNQGVELLPPGKSLFRQLATYGGGAPPSLLRLLR